MSYEPIHNPGNLKFGVDDRPKRRVSGIFQSKAFNIFLMTSPLWAIFAGAVAPKIYDHCHQEDITFTVKEKQPTNAGGFIHTTEGKTLSNYNDMWSHKSNSAQLYGELEEGKTYKAHVIGVETHNVWLGEKYPNIITIEKLSR